MAERLPFKSTDYLAGTSMTNRGVFCHVVDVMASNDRRRVAGLDDELSTGVRDLAAILRVVSDYLAVRNDSPSSSVFADDSDVYRTVFAVSDLMELLAAASDKSAEAKSGKEG